MTEPRLRHQANPNRDPQPYRGPGTGDEAARVRDSVRRDPDYAPTPIRARPRTALGLGLGALTLKDEGARLRDAGLGSFKPLGVMGAMAHLAQRGGPLPRHLVCASDGNFGRAVAWGAARAGLSATVYVPRAVSPGRVAAIEGFGARVVRVPGGYDRAMAAARQVAGTKDVLEMTDTGYGDTVTLPAIIQMSYGVIAREVLQALGPGDRPPTHVFCCAGVGGLVAGMVAAFDDMLGPDAPKVISVQPDCTPSLLDSLAAGRLRGAPDLSDPDPARRTIMVGLSCETPSTVAWPILARRLSHALAINDAAALHAMRDLAQGRDAPPIVTGESGAAAYGGLLAACSDPQVKAALGLDARAHVLVLLTETATDRAVYDALLDGQALA